MNLGGSEEIFPVDAASSEFRCVGVAMMTGPSIVPGATRDQTVYLVIEDFGYSGCAYRETDVERADLETTIDDLLNWQSTSPVRVVAFNIAEGWSSDASQDVAKVLAVAMIGANATFR